MMASMKAMRVFALCMTLAFMALDGGFAQAQTTEADLSARLAGKPLFLRGFWAEDKLKFDGNGEPANTYKQTSFTVSGFDAATVQVEGDTLRLTGPRIALSFDANGTPVRSLLPESKKKNAKPEMIRIEVQRGADGTFGRALDAIFAEGLGQVVPLLPDCWQLYANKHFLPASPERGPDGTAAPSPAAAKAQEDGPIHIDGQVRPPRVLSSVDPPYTETARRLKVSGIVKLYLRLGPDGQPSHVRIVQPLGLGLDEQAVAALKQYRFAPATQEGKPVKVDLYLDVNFRIF